MKQLWLIILVLLFATACTAQAESEAAQQAQQTVATPTAVPPQRAPVRIAPVETGDIAEVLEYNGTLLPQSDVDVRTRLSSLSLAKEIAAILVEVGDPVEADQAIALLNDDTEKNAVASAEVNLALSRISLTRLEAGSRPEEIIAAQTSVEQARAQLADTEFVDDSERNQAILNLARAEADLRQAQADYDKIAWAGNVAETSQAVALEQATASYEAALAQYDLDVNIRDANLAPLRSQLAQSELQLALTLNPYRDYEFEQARLQIQQSEISLADAQLQLDNTVIRAPFDGFVASVEADEGDLATSSTTIARIVSNELEVRVDIEESRINSVQRGLPVALQVQAYPGRTFPAVVSSVSPLADLSTHTFEVTILPQDDEGLLKGGMFADVDILTSTSQDALLVPRAAINLVNGQQAVYVVQTVDNVRSVELRPVTTGLSSDTQIEILAGVEAGESVVIAGQTRLRDGSEVVIIEE